MVLEYKKINKYRWKSFLRNIKYKINEIKTIIIEIKKKHAIKGAFPINSIIPNILNLE